MSPVGNELLVQLVIPFTVRLFFIAGLLGLAVGIGLILRPSIFFRMSETLNRHRSARRGFKSMEIPRDIGERVYENHRWYGTVIALCSAYVIFGLATKAGAAQIMSVVGGRGATVADWVAWMASAAWWLLIVGSVAGVVVGVLLAWFPDRLRAIERQANRWVSSRQIGRGASTVHLHMDGLVARHPGIAGWLIAIPSAALVIQFGMLLHFRP